jgi:tetratricopeptide (TPR) repeat protein
MRQSDIVAGQALARQGLAEARSLRLRGVEGRMLNAMAMAADIQGDLVGLLELNRQSLHSFRESGDRINEAISLSNLGDCWTKLGGLAQARRELDAGLPLARANGDRVMEGSMLGTLSTLVLWQGDETRALALARQALDIVVAAQAPEDEVSARLCLGNAESALGRAAAARKAYEQARARALDIASLRQHDISAGLARVALAEGDHAAALAALQPVLDLVAAGGTLDRTEYPRLIELTCHQTLARANDPRAAEWLVRAHTALMNQADTITDPALRESFLRNIPHHREITAAWAKRDLRG